MENSQTLMNDPALSASNSKAAEDASPEESSWTFYMQDFLCGGDNNDSFSSDHYGTSSLVSDAASSVAIRLARNNNEPVLFASERSNCNKLSSKRQRKAKGAGASDDLEDTASSPVNSPKVSYMNQLIFKQNERNNKNVSDFNNQGLISSNNNHKGLGIVEGSSNYSELKKEGLCLVPVSMLSNYIG